MARKPGSRPRGYVTGIPAKAIIPPGALVGTPPINPWFKAINNLKISNTVRVRTALAQTDRNVIVACIGPSTTRGQSTGAGAVQAIQSWPMRLADMLQAQGINAGASNFFGDAGSWGQAQSLTNFKSGDGRIASSGAAQLGGNRTAGGNAFYYPNAASSITFTPHKPVSRFEICWRDASTGRTFAGSIDGGAATQITSSGASIVRRTLLPAVARGIHSLDMPWVAGAPTLIGVYAYDDTNSRREISILNWGISGAPSARFIDNSDSSDGTATGTPIASYQALMAAYTPDLIIIDDVPINDWRQSVPIATSRANITALVQQAKASGATVVMTTPLWDASTGGLSAQQDAYAAMCVEIAVAEDIPWLDIRSAWVSYRMALAAKLMSDSIHPSAIGYDFKAGEVFWLFRALQALQA